MLVWAQLSVSPARAAEGAPEDWLVELATQTIRNGPIEFRYEPHLEDGAKYLSQQVPSWWSEIEHTIAFDLDDHVVITYVDHAGRVADATEMPQWVAGVAHPSSGEVLIARHGPDGRPTDLAALLRHELTHVALYRATEGATVPRWFNEGLAESLEGNVDLGRVQTLATMVFGSGVPSVEHLEAQFRQPEGARAAEAYAAARDLVNFLRFHDGSGAELRRLLGQLRMGYAFETAFVRSYGVSQSEMVEAWRDGLPVRYFWFPMLAGGGVPMVIVFPLLVAAWLRRHRQRQIAWARLEHEDELLRAGYGLAV